MSAIICHGLMIVNTYLKETRSAWHIAGERKSLFQKLFAPFVPSLRLCAKRSVLAKAQRRKDKAQSIICVFLV
jgi:hypothetical protein